MFNMPQQISGISHPLVASMYFKKEFTHHHHPEDVLVIETTVKDDDLDDDADNTSFDTYLAELLTDLEGLKAKAEEQVGHIDRIDIRSY